MLALQVLAPARSVVLASGTLAPLASLQQQLFPHVPPERVRLFSCGHVVPHTNHLPLQLNCDHFSIVKGNPVLHKTTSAAQRHAYSLDNSFMAVCRNEEAATDDDAGTSSQVGQSIAEAECRAGRRTDLSTIFTPMPPVILLYTSRFCRTTSPHSLQVPKDRLLALALGQGPTGAVLDLRHARRGQNGMLDELGRVLINACQAVPQV